MCKQALPSEKVATGLRASSRKELLSDLTMWNKTEEKCEKWEQRKACGNRILPTGVDQLIIPNRQPDQHSENMDFHPNLEPFSKLSLQNCKKFTGGAFSICLARFSSLFDAKLIPFCSSCVREADEIEILPPEEEELDNVRNVDVDHVDNVRNVQKIEFYNNGTKDGGF